MSKVGVSILTWILLAPLVLLVLFPYAVMFVTAIKPADEVIAPTWWPSAPRWANFVDMWQATHFGPALLNSLYTALASTILALVAAIPAAYGLSRFRFAGRRGVNTILLASQMISPIVLVIGLFRLAAALGLVDDLNTVAFVYAAFNVAFAVWMLQSYFETIPRDLEEAAWIEGASRARALWSVFLPLAVPGIVVTAIFTLINAWNEFVIALTLLRRNDNFTLPVQIFDLVAGRYQVEWQSVMAAALTASLPAAIMFACLQRYLVRSAAFGPIR